MRSYQSQKICKLKNIVNFLGC